MPTLRCVAAVQTGEIVAIKGLGGYQLACDATNAEAVARLRAAKRRDAKPFALMARDLDVIRRYCAVIAGRGSALLTGPEAPIVLLTATGRRALPDAIAPGLRTLGFMLPTTPLHLAAAARASTRPVVMTSGNLSDEPQITDDDEARERLPAIADAVLVARPADRHAHRRFGGARDGRRAPRVLRRARGFAPAPIALPAGFADAPDLLALGGELKATFCLVKDGEAILSQHMGDLEDAATFDDYRTNLAHYATLFDHAPAALAADLPSGISVVEAARAETERLRLIEVQHHHAHVAACLAENGRAARTRRRCSASCSTGSAGATTARSGAANSCLPTIATAERLGTFKPVAMPGGAQRCASPGAISMAHLHGELGCAAFHRASCIAAAAKPRATIDAMIKRGVNAPLASSCGRLFDAVAAALGICRERQAHEGEAAARLEALACEPTLSATRQAMRDDACHPAPGHRSLRAADEDVMACASAAPCGARSLGDLTCGAPARDHRRARFHRASPSAHRGDGRAARRAATPTAARASTRSRCPAAASRTACCSSSGVGCLEAGFAVLTHRAVPANDGGLALGQAAIGRGASSIGA